MKHGEDSRNDRTCLSREKDRSKLSLPRRQSSRTAKGSTNIERYASQRARPSDTEVCGLLNDTQTDILPGYPESAICVQRFDDSLHSAIHITYRNWLRSSSMHEPRDPPLEVVLLFVFIRRT